MKQAAVELWYIWRGDARGLTALRKSAKRSVREEEDQNRGALGRLWGALPFGRRAEEEKEGDETSFQEVAKALKASVEETKLPTPETAPIQTVEWKDFAARPGLDHFVNLHLVVGEITITAALDVDAENRAITYGRNKDQEGETKDNNGSESSLIQPRKPSEDTKKKWKALLRAFSHARKSGWEGRGAIVVCSLRGFSLSAGMWQPVWVEPPPWLLRLVPRKEIAKAQEERANRPNFAPPPSGFSAKLSLQNLGIYDEVTLSNLRYPLLKRRAKELEFLLGITSKLPKGRPQRQGETLAYKQAVSKPLFHLDASIFQSWPGHKLNVAPPGTLPVTVRGDVQPLDLRLSMHVLKPLMQFIGAVAPLHDLYAARHEYVVALPPVPTTDVASTAPSQPTTASSDFSLFHIHDSLSILFTIASVRIVVPLKPDSRDTTMVVMHSGDITIASSENFSDVDHRARFSRTAFTELIQNPRLSASSSLVRPSQPEFSSPVRATKSPVKGGGPVESVWVSVSGFEVLLARGCSFGPLLRMSASPFISETPQLLLPVTLQIGAGLRKKGISSNSPDISVSVVGKVSPQRGLIVVFDVSGHRLRLQGTPDGYLPQNMAFVANWKPTWCSSHGSIGCTGAEYRGNTATPSNSRNSGTGREDRDGEFLQ